MACCHNFTYKAVAVNATNTELDTTDVLEIYYDTNSSKIRIFFNVSEEKNLTLKIKGTDEWGRSLVSSNSFSIWI